MTLMRLLSLTLLAALTLPATDCQETYGEPTLRFFTFSSSESQFTYVALSTVNDYNNHVNRTNAVELYRFEHTDILDRSVYKRWLDTLGAPDLLPLYTGPRAREFLDAGKMSDLSDVWDETGLHGDVLPLADALVSGQAGEKFGIPLLATGSMCMYRKSVFRTIGVSTPPQTWDELLALCQAFADVGIPCLGNDLATLPPTQYFDSLAIRMHGNEFYANFTDAGISFTDPRVLAVFDELIPLVGKGYFARPPSPSPGLDRVLVDIDEALLRPVLPPIGKPVVVVRGEHAGERGVLVDHMPSDKSLAVRLDATGITVRGLGYAAVCKVRARG